MHLDDDYAWSPQHDPFDEDRTDRVTHLVMVDGRLVETWSEPAQGTRWQRFADRFDAERRPLPPSPPPTPPWQRALEWLDDVCGGREAVHALTAEPLDAGGCELPTDAGADGRSRLEATADLLDAVAERWFDPEMATALPRALVRVWAEEPEAVLHARSAAHLAGGLCWAVGKANGCFHPQGPLTMARVQEALALSSSISGYGATVRRALIGFRTAGRERWWRPDGVPALEPLGDPGLLCSATRARLVRVRDRAEAARRAAGEAA